MPHSPSRKDQLPVFPLPGQRRQQIAAAPSVPKDWRLEPQFATAYLAWRQQPGPATAKQLLRKLRPIIDLAVRTYGGPSSRSPILRSKAEVLALQTLQRYDPRTSGLRTFLMSQLRSLQRLGARQATPLYVPERQALLVNQLTQLEDKMREELGRDPTLVELADRSGLSMDKIHQVRSGYSFVNTGSLEQTTENQPSAIGVEQQNRSAFRNAWERMVYLSLPRGTRQLVFEYMFGINGRPKLSGKEIAKRLGISPSAVSQHMAKIKAELDRMYELSPFEGE